MRNSTVRKVKRDGSVILQDVPSRPWADYYEQHQARVETLRFDSDPQDIDPTQNPKFKIAPKPKARNPRVLKQTPSI